MAKTVYEQHTFELQDGREVTLAPLPIGRLKKFMKQWSKFEGIEKSDDEYASFDIYVNCCGVALDSQMKDTFDQRVNAEGELSEEYREYLEDVLDIDTIFKIIEICGGINFNDPKLQEAVEAMERAEAVGTN